ncbi:hypothetical protein OAK45_02915 [Verrucomicrobia bacterium]|nr:hypothetical protein [Verrucomicrobiota bacterium]MDC0219085.1 hypothetical protein [Verrucomicrobiota bacterium]
MNTRNLKTIAFAVGFIASGAGFAADKTTYEDDVLPIFRNNCLKCHNADKMRADLDLATFDALMNGSGNGEVVAGGDLDNSLLYQLVTHAEKPVMPPKSKLADSEIATIKAWIVGGLLKDSGSKALMANKPKIDLTLDPDSLGKRPEGPAPMPVEVFSLDPYQRTERTSISTAIAVSPWAPLVAIGSQRQVLLYNTDTLKIAGIIPYPKGYPHSVNFSASGKLLIIGGGRGANLGFSTVWDIIKGQQILTVGEDLDSVLASDISADQRYIAHGGPDRLVRIFSTDTGEMLHKIKKHTDWVTAMRFSPKGKYVASGDRAGGIHVWEAEPGGRASSLMGHRGRITGLEWASTNIVISASEDGTAKMWNIDEVRQLKSWTAHSGGALSLRRAQNGNMVTVGRNRRATLWDASGNAKRTFTFTGDIPSTGVPSNDGKLVIGTDWNGEVYVWNAADGKEVTRLALNPAPMADQFIAAQKLVEQKSAATKAATAVHQSVLTRIAKTKAQMTALDTTVTMRQKAVTDSKATLAKLIAEKQKPAQAKAGTTAVSLKAATAAKVAADKALAAADETGKPAAQAQATTAAKVLADATAAKAVADKVLAAINAQVTQATTVNAAAGKSLIEAQNAAKTGKVALTKLLGVLAAAANTEQGKVTAAGAAFTAAQKDAELLRLNKTYSEYYHARNQLAAQEAKLAELQATAKAAQTALAGTQTELDAVRKTDLAKLKADKLVTFIQAKADKAKADQALIAAQAEVAKAGETVTVATKAVASAEGGMKAAGINLITAKTAHTKATAASKTARDKANAAKTTYDQLASAKQAPAQLINVTLTKAITQANTAKANVAKVLVAVNTEVNAATTASTGADNTAKASEKIAATAKTVMDKLAADLAKQKTDLSAKQKMQVTTKAALDQLIAQKQKPSEAKVVAAAALLKQAPVTKAAADKAQVAANAAVKTALKKYLAAEMTAQTAEAGAGNDAAKQAAAAAKRKDAAADKTALDQLIADQQKVVLAQVAKANAAMKAAPVTKAAADKELAAAKAEVAKATATYNAATQAVAAAQKIMITTTANHAKARADFTAKQVDATAKRKVANTAKAKRDGLVADKQVPAQNAVTAAGATATELAAAKVAAVAILTRVNAEMVVAAKPFQALDAAATTVEAKVKPAEAVVTKMTTAMDIAGQLVTQRKTEAANAKAAMDKMVAEKIKPMEAQVAVAVGAMTTAQAAHDDAEKNHQSRVAALAKMVADQSLTAKTSTDEAGKLATTVSAEQKRVEALKAEYEKLKGPIKTAAK